MGIILLWLRAPFDRLLIYILEWFRIFYARIHLTVFAFLIPSPGLTIAVRILRPLQAPWLLPIAIPLLFLSLWSLYPFRPTCPLLIPIDSPLLLRCPSMSLLMVSRLFVLQALANLRLLTRPRSAEFMCIVAPRLPSLMLMSWPMQFMMVVTNSMSV